MLTKQSWLKSLGCYWNKNIPTFQHFSCFLSGFSFATVRGSLVASFILFVLRGLSHPEACHCLCRGWFHAAQNPGAKQQVTWYEQLSVLLQCMLGECGCLVFGPYKKIKNMMWLLAAGVTLSTQAVEVVYI